MNNFEFIETAKRLVSDYTNKHTDVTDNVAPISVADCYVVWCCKTLQNSKALLSTPRLDGMYYEVTYNGDKHEIYFDAYKKFENRCIPEDIHRKKSDNNTFRRVNQYTKNRKYVATYESEIDAERATGAKGTNIAKCCRNKRDFAGGFIWRYTDNDEFLGIA